MKKSSAKSVKKAGGGDVVAIFRGIPGNPHAIAVKAFAADAQKLLQLQKLGSVFQVDDAQDATHNHTYGVVHVKKKCLAVMLDYIPPAQALHQPLIQVAQPGEVPPAQDAAGKIITPNDFLKKGEPPN